MYKGTPGIFMISVIVLFESSGALFIAYNTENRFGGTDPVVPKVPRYTSGFV